VTCIAGTVNSHCCSVRAPSLLNQSCSVRVFHSVAWRSTMRGSTAAAAHTSCSQPSLSGSEAPATGWDTALA